MLIKKNSLNKDELIKKTIKKNKTFEENRKRVSNKLAKITEGRLSDNFWKKAWTIHVIWQLPRQCLQY